MRILGNPYRQRKEFLCFRHLLENTNPAAMSPLRECPSARQLGSLTVEVVNFQNCFYLLAFCCFSLFHAALYLTPAITSILFRGIPIFIVSRLIVDK